MTVENTFCRLAYTTQQGTEGIWWCFCLLENKLSYWGEVWNRQTQQTEKYVICIKTPLRFQSDTKKMSCRWVSGCNYGSCMEAQTKHKNIQTPFYQKWSCIWISDAVGRSWQHKTTTVNDLNMLPWLSALASALPANHRADSCGFALLRCHFPCTMKQYRCHV